MENKNEDSAEIMDSLIKALRTNANALNSVLGYKSNASIYNVLGGLQSLTTSMAYRIKEKFPHVNENYLTKKELPILLEDPPELSKKHLPIDAKWEDVPNILHKIMLSVQEISLKINK